MGDSQGECAQKAEQLGLSWKQSHVSNIEKGERQSITIEELVVLSKIYGVPISEWFEGEAEMKVTKSQALPLSDVRAMLTAKRATSRVIDFSKAPDYSADASIAKRLGVTQERVTQLSRELWGHHATVERDKRLAHHGNKEASLMRNLRTGMTKRLAGEIQLHIGDLGE